jgi:FlaA1/EpsC-like NDP-sugar epimerase
VVGATLLLERLLGEPLARRLPGWIGAGLAALAATGLVGLAALAVRAAFPSGAASLPIVVLLVYTVLGAAALAGTRLRLLPRAPGPAPALPDAKRPPARRVVLIGTGPSAVQLARELEARPQLGIVAVGFVTEGSGRAASTLQGLPVLGPVESLPSLATERRLDEAVVALESPRAETLRGLRPSCIAAGLGMTLAPPPSERPPDAPLVGQLRAVEIEDLLGRQPIALDEQAVLGALAGRRVMVTGAAGRVAADLCRQIAAFEPAQLALLDQAESALATLHRELGETYPGLVVTPIIADICDTRRLGDVFRMVRPEVVIHVAAHTNVPLLEANPGEAVKNNAFGARKVVDAAAAAGCERLLLVSSDKAARPRSVMGATKRIAEMYVQSLAARTHKPYAAIRLGNVLGGEGSVVSVFRRQLALGHALTLTDPAMERFFVSGPAAAQLVLQALTTAGPGDVMFPDMGPRVRIADVAGLMQELAGRRPGEGPAPQVIGVRPGEKLAEEDGRDAALSVASGHPGLFALRLEPPTTDKVEEIYAALSGIPDAQDPGRVRRRIARLLPDFQEPGPITDPGESRPPGGVGLGSLIE